MNKTKQCLLFPDEPGKCETIITIKRISAILSLIGCLYMILVICVNRKYVALSFRLVLNLSVAALLKSISFLFGAPFDYSPACTFEGWLILFSGWAVLLWVTCITVNLVRSICQKTTDTFIEGVYMGICWLLSLILASVPLVDNQYGPAGAWCYLTGSTWQFLLWYGPLVLLIIAVTVMVVYVTVTVNRKVNSWRGMYTPEQEAERTMLKEDIKPLRAYPLVFLCCSLFPLITRIYNAAHQGEKPVFFLYIMMVLFKPVEGALNAIVFGIDPDTRRQMSPRALYWTLRGVGQRRPEEIREYPENMSQGEQYSGEQLQDSHELEDGSNFPEHGGVGRERL